MTNGAHQGSVLGPLLFVIWIKDLDVNVNGFVSKFVDDAKIGGVVNSEEYCQKKKVGYRSPAGMGREMAGGI